MQAQVTETLAEGLKREYRVVVPVANLDAKLNERLGELKNQVRINGFRPGKVPVAHLKRLYGRAVMAEAMEAAVREANASIVSQNNYKLAMDPRVVWPSEKSAVDEMIEGRSDLSYSVALEILPKIELTDFSTIKLDKFVSAVSEKEVDEAVEGIAAQNRPFEPKGEKAKAENGDKVTISFTGTIDGKPFEGGSAEDIGVEIGSNTFIPGFEEQLIGIKADQSRRVEVTFPKNYLSKELAGKSAAFEVTAKSIEKRGTLAVDDEFAKSLGMESLEKLKEAVKGRIEAEHAAATRAKLKRALLDQLDERHRFELPPTLVEEEFAGVWKTIVSDLESQNRTFTDEGTTEEAAKADYRKISERRVRLGLVIAEIGERNTINVTDEELSRAVVERARQLPGQEQQVWDYYRKNPAAVASLRAPIYEEKVVDFLLELVKVTEKTVSRDELYKEDDEATPV